MLSAKAFRLSLRDIFSPRVIVDTQETVGKFRQNIKATQSHMGEETHLSRDVAKLNGKGRPLWAGGKTPAGRSDGHEDFMLIRLYHGPVL